ncbi:MAG TPA: Sir2 family NAD-dependent protein deacetylase [Acidimicrobiales bacterium]
MSIQDGDPGEDIGGDIDGGSSGSVEGLVTEVRGWVAAARSVVALTGAGISTDSGIPDFRGPNGVWTRNPEAEKRATLHHYMSDPEIRRGAWLDRLDHPAWAAEPNAGHRALVDLERRGSLDTLITQNVDGLHQAAGSDPHRVIEVHGTVHEAMCMSCDERAPMRRVLDRVRAGEADPPCRTCGGILKSATISFGQSLVADDIERAGAAARRADLLLAVGSTLSVFPVADVVPVARMSGARVVIVNGGETAMDHLADAVIRGPISELLPRIVAG